MFSPCLIRCPETDALVVMECLPKEGMFINRLLKDYIYMRNMQDNPEFAEAERAKMHQREAEAAKAAEGGGEQRGGEQQHEGEEGDEEAGKEKEEHGEEGAAAEEDPSHYG